MHDTVEYYRGIKITLSSLVLWDSSNGTRPSDWYEATVNGWRLVGTLKGVKKDIDNKLGLADSKILSLRP